MAFTSFSSTGPYSRLYLTSISTATTFIVNPYTFTYLSGKKDNCTAFDHLTTSELRFILYLSKDKELPIRLYKNDKINVTQNCNITYAYNTVLQYPKYGVISLTTKAVNITVVNTNNTMAPNREYNYLFNVSAWNLSLGEYARNYSKYYVQLSCLFDLSVVSDIDLGKYRSKSPMI